MLGDHYYRSYDDSRADGIHAPVWKLRQGDIFATFGTCREWFMGTFPTAEVLHQKQRTHDQVYHSHVLAQANQLSNGNQIMREWRSMHRQLGVWEDFRSCLAADAIQFEKAKAELAEQKARFEANKKKEDWGILGLKKKLQASKDKLAEKHRLLRETCKKDNEKMYAARTEITNLKAQAESSAKTIADLEERYEAAKVHPERAEITRFVLLLSVLNR
ncbi:hypothetical protein HanXRQr2_Chr09g0391441 [Helianthus annuus]|uniref:Uncharacterized protein n=1 Tax=Helianthus annuus TaxID=4232 RepID=A0A9K3I6N7_HELAN|nr:hypothetical protein HanXRQr2_Chr09g0391441 [Helianthus annuus]KAJ0534669.1 hypothetical protein HanIR_Chr09g0422291 [Helianthus annuus]KAJ0542664.1 hypothetical protein HanHA89_Chr09g0342221 [Helianthus annuus]KAJ0893425.1 hypothetical protein HanPSC8_Chr09g0377431 [Helianthus annuus]